MADVWSNPAIAMKLPRRLAQTVRQVAPAQQPMPIAPAPMADEMQLPPTAPTFYPPSVSEIAGAIDRLERTVRAEKRIVTDDDGNIIGWKVVTDGVL